MSSIVGDQRLVVHLPVYIDNPYQKILIAAQRKRGWQVVDGGGGGDFFQGQFGVIGKQHIPGSSCALVAPVSSATRRRRIMASRTTIPAGDKHVESRRLSNSLDGLHNLVNHDRLYPKIDLQGTHPNVCKSR